MKEKQNYYFTLGQSHIHTLEDDDDIFNTIVWDKNGIVKVIAENETKARDFIFSLVGSKWAFCYDDNNINVKYFPNGIIKTFDIC